MSHYTESPLHVEHVGKNGYRLLSPIIWQLVYGSDRIVCVIPDGFTTDYDSTPWYARPFLRNRHLARKAHALHDWGYNRGWVWMNVVSRETMIGKSYQSDDILMLTRSEWDLIWRDAMIVEGMGKGTARLMYQALKLFGFIRWNECASKRSALFKAEQLKLTKV